jgi:hypothetical protein
MRRVFLVLLAVLVAVLLAGCTTNKPTITQAQALARVERLIRDTAAAITPAPRLELIPSSVPPSMCLHDDESQEQVVISRSYWLRDIPQSDNMSISRQVRAYWEKQGHVIVAAGNANNPDLSGSSRPDHFNLALTWAEGDHLYLGAASTCVWPDGTPPPGR